MGIYRLLLAIMVLLSHLGIVILGHNQGISAVVSFFMISGFSMTALIQRNYNAPTRIYAFYVDRVMRLFPQFIFYMLATTVLILLVKPESPFLSGITMGKAVLNYAMLPLNFYMLGFGDALLMPQAWSLGLEACFYISIPVLLIFQLELLAFIISVGIFVLACFNVINPDFFGYRLLPGTLFMFLIGSFFYKRQNFIRTILLAVSYVLSIGFFLSLTYHAGSKISPAVHDVLVGIIVGLPIVAWLTKMKLGKIDFMLGNLSYGVFLNHFFLIWSFRAFGIEPHGFLRVSALIALSIALALITFWFIERPVIQYRRRIRYQPNATATPVGTS
ncbi:acyltransferase [Robbsia sp. KACC 23696]|uniref:acyltransferase family protein n=1 Tax=Robbsia sp. KACC 23696 TaxID=3149231 RepID=UPI00325BB411